MKFIYLIFIITLLACNEKKTSQGVIAVKGIDSIINNSTDTDQVDHYADSLNVVYRKHGFNSFCEAVLKDDLNYIEADIIMQVKYGKEAIGSDYFTKAVSKKADQLYAKWLVTHHLKKVSFNEDRFQTIRNHGSYCDLEIKSAISSGRVKLYYKYGLTPPY